MLVEITYFGGNSKSVRYFVPCVFFAVMIAGMFLTPKNNFKITWCEYEARFNYHGQERVKGTVWKSRATNLIVMI